jgi:pyruvate kinase
MMISRRTKIVCTLGPACDDPVILNKMVEAGMNVARLNLSHGTYAEHEQRIKTLKAINLEIAIIADLQGPRIRTGALKQKEIKLKAGARITLTSKTVAGDENLLSLSPASIISSLKTGESILIADGTIKLKVTAKKAGAVDCRVVEGGVMGEHKGVNLPQTTLNFPSITNKDKQDVDWAIRNKVDYLALSFVRKAKDVLALKKLLKKKRADIPVIAKIEKGEALKNLKTIIQVSDAVMVARGDLGVELSLKMVPIIQKNILQLCRLQEKPVIVATQMLETMVNSPTPTRAEVSDVANAIFDRADAVMLSEETSIGKFPVEAVKMMAGIAEEADKQVKFSALEPAGFDNVSIAAAHAACVLARDVNARAIITFTETGSTALRVSKHRPEMPIFGVVTNERTARRLNLYAGVYPLKIKPFRFIDQMIWQMEDVMLRSGLLKKNEMVVITAGVPVNIPGTTNFIKVHKIGEKRTL